MVLDSQFCTAGVLFTTGYSQLEMRWYQEICFSLCTKSSTIVMISHYLGVCCLNRVNSLGKWQLKILAMKVQQCTVEGFILVAVGFWLLHTVSGKNNKLGNYFFLQVWKTDLAIIPFLSYLFTNSYLPKQFKTLTYINDGENSQKVDYFGSE